MAVVAGADLAVVAEVEQRVLGNGRGGGKADDGAVALLRGAEHGEGRAGRAALGAAAGPEVGRADRPVDRAGSSGSGSRTTKRGRTSSVFWALSSRALPRLLRSATAVDTPRRTRIPRPHDDLRDPPYPIKWVCGGSGELVDEPFSALADNEVGKLKPDCEACSILVVTT